MLRKLYKTDRFHPCPNKATTTTGGTGGYEKDTGNEEFSDLLVEEQ